MTDPRNIPKNHPVRSKQLPWYTPSVEGKLSPQSRKLFQEYSGIAPEEVDSHVDQVRDLAWDICPWPCIGECWFAAFGLRKHPQYARLVSFLQEPPKSRNDSKPAPTFLDVGTCLGQDLRALHHDGVPISRLYGSDLVPEFEDAGHALFKDADRFTSEHFIIGDIFDDNPETSPLAKTAGTWSVVQLSSTLPPTLTMTAKTIVSASEVLASALQSSIALYEVIQGFHVCPRCVRDLLKELEALRGRLSLLTDMVKITTMVYFSALGLPLRRCGDACTKFEQEILQCLSRSGDSRTSFRGWASLRYLNDDIDGFRRLLAGYTSTITIALIDANLRKSSATAKTFHNYGSVMKNAKNDLEAQLDSIDNKLKHMVREAIAVSERIMLELQLLEEQSSVKKCLQICDCFATHIEQLEIYRRHNNGLVNNNASPETIIDRGLQENEESLTPTAVNLAKHMRNPIDQVVLRSKRSIMPQENISEVIRLREMVHTNIFSREDNFPMKTISTIDNYSTGDAVQFMVSTNGKVIHGRNRGRGWRTRQVGGYLGDSTVQKISQSLTMCIDKTEPSVDLQ